MLKLTNICGGQVVCDLAVEGKTLRLDNKQSTTIEDFEITPHISNMIASGLILSEKVSVVETKKTTKKTAKSSKEKEE